MRLLYQPSGPMDCPLVGPMNPSCHKLTVPFNLKCTMTTRHHVCVSKPTSLVNICVSALQD